MPPTIIGTELPSQSQFSCLICIDRYSKYWKASPDSNSDANDNTWWYRPVSADVETTAYALLTTLLLTENKIDEGLPIVRWLSSQRNAYGGFGSTQVSIENTF